MHHAKQLHVSFSQHCFASICFSCHRYALLFLTLLDYAFPDKAFFSFRGFPSSRISSLCTADRTRHEGPAVFAPQTLGTGRRAGRQLLTFASLLFVFPCSALLCSALPGTLLLFLLYFPLLFLPLLCSALPQIALLCFVCFVFPGNALLFLVLLCFALLCLALLCLHWPCFLLLFQATLSFV